MGKERLLELIEELLEDRTLEIIPHPMIVGANGNQIQVDIEIKINGSTVQYNRG